MSQVKHHVSGREYWQSLEQLAQSKDPGAHSGGEFKGYDPELIKQGTSRRNFLKYMGASMALAGLTLSGCRRWPREELVPRTANPEGRIPGIPEIYATVMELNGVGVGLLATSFDGRPIKLEGNPLHPFARVNDRHGSADAFAQASVLELYDPDRCRGFYVRQGNEYRATDFAGFREAAETLFPAEGAGVLVISENSNSPSVAEMKKRFAAKFPHAKWVEYEPISHDNERLATQKAFGRPLRTRLKIDQADVVFCLDDDILGAHPAHTRYSADWAVRRKSADNGSMNRVYLVESCFSITGAVADQRLPARPSRMLPIITALAQKLGVSGINAVGSLDEKEEQFVSAAADDLKSAGPKAIITAGSQLPPDAQAVALAINERLGAIDNTVVLLPVPDADRPTHADGIRAAADQIKSGQVKTLLIIGGNPAYDAPADLEFAKLLTEVPNSIHLSIYRNETSIACTWNLPKAHYLEAWGDARAYDGTISIAQPLIEPLFSGVSTIELLAALSGDKLTEGRAIVRRTIEPMLAGADKEKAIRRVICDGVLPDSGYAPVRLAIQRFTVAAPAEANGYEIRFQPDQKVFDGRFANSGWLQETPDSVTKLTWDNAALVNPADAKKLGIATGDVIKLAANGRSLEIVTFIVPGQPIGVIGLPLGYGRIASGHIGNGVGFNTYQLRTDGARFVAMATGIARTGDKYPLSCLQDQYDLDSVGREGIPPRAGEKYQSGILIHEATLEEYRKNPRAALPRQEKGLPLELFQPPMQFNHPHAWGMAIDMNACIGCNACVVACQSENNVPVVGKIEVATGRQMQWLRIDRYFKGDMHDPNPEVAFQPIMCIHCENAPCEQVCPVGATMHDTEGLNVMVYNRCVGTRYCSNNCPYKVRRFNYLDFQSLDPRGGRFPAPYLNIPDLQQRESIDTIKQMVFNPEVTVRMRGVMEKCTLCIQRIKNGEIKAKNDYLAGKRESILVQDGEVLTACQQSCPTQAIIFGNLNDPKARVTQLHKNPRAYSLLEELNTRPRGKHLAKIRNPNGALERRTERVQQA